MTKLRACCPRPVRVGGDAEDVHVAATDLQDEEHMKALAGERAVHMEEITSEDGRRLRVEEAPSGGVVAAYRWSWAQDATGTVSVRLAEPVPAAGQRLLDAEAQRLTAWLDGFRVPTVYTSPAMKPCAGDARG
jgi:hypothetical protein